MKKDKLCAVMAAIMAACIVVSTFSDIISGVPSVSAAENISNPRIEEDGTVTWDTVEFGTYPQSIKYFKTEPIKWRILSVNEDGSDAFVIADKCLDSKSYAPNPPDFVIDESGYHVANNTWDKCILRSWLNHDFLDEAFTAEEKSAIKPTDVDFESGYDTVEDYISSETGDNTEISKDYVFVLSMDEVTNKDYGFDEDYSKEDPARVSRITDYARFNGGSVGYRRKEGYVNGEWILRSPRIREDSILAVRGNIVGYPSYISLDCSVRPAMHINLNSLYVNPAGEIDSEENVYDINDGYSNPRKQNGVVTWDCVYLGSYKQTAVYEEEPIKWRVLSVNKDGTDALLLSDKLLDHVLYHDDFEETYIRWEKCFARKWLNSEFLAKAFTEEEQAVINDHLVEADQNLVTLRRNENSTIDKVFYLSMAEAVNYKYGFCEEYEDPDKKVKDYETRIAYTTDYAWMMGTACQPNKRNWYWDLRTVGLYDHLNAGVHPSGDVLYGGGNSKGSGYMSCRPAICVNLNSDLVKYAGYITSPGGTYKPESDEPEDPVNPDDPDGPVKPDNPGNPTNPDGKTNPINPVTPTEPAKSTESTTFNIKNKSKVKKTAKIKIKDKDKIKKITLNGKKIKIKANKTSITIKLKSYSKLLKKKGKWNKLIVVDKKGNKKQILFKIK